jgi:hypothetical protein
LRSMINLIKSYVPRREPGATPHHPPATERIRPNAS